MGHLRREGVQTRRKVRKLDDELVSRAAREYAEGRTLAELGERYGVDAETLRREFERVAVIGRRPGRR